jgi:hypothetical protein
VVAAAARRCSADQGLEGFAPAAPRRLARRAPAALHRSPARWTRRAAPTADAAVAALAIHLLSSSAAAEGEGQGGRAGAGRGEEAGGGVGEDAQQPAAGGEAAEELRCAPAGRAGDAAGSQGSTILTHSRAQASAARCRPRRRLTATSSGRSMSASSASAACSPSASRCAETAGGARICVPGLRRSRAARPAAAKGAARDQPVHQGAGQEPGCASGALPVAPRFALTRASRALQPPTCSS